MSPTLATKTEPNHDSVAMDDSILAMEEAHRLAKYIDSMQYYRYRNCIYDPWRYKPIYTISEFAWTFTQHPCIAPLTAIYLNEVLEDVPDLKDMNKQEMVIACRKYIDAFHALQAQTSVKSMENYIKKNKRVRALALVMRVFAQNSFYNTVLKQEKLLYDVGRERLIALHEIDHWAPALDFYQRIYDRD